MNKGVSFSTINNQSFIIYEKKKLDSEKTNNKCLF